MILSSGWGSSSDRFACSKPNLNPANVLPLPVGAVIVYMPRGFAPAFLLQSETFARIELIGEFLLNKLSCSSSLSNRIAQET